MKELDDFLSRWKIELSPQDKRWCRRGWKKMKGSPDKLHNEDHVSEVLGNIEELLRAEKIKKETIDWRILLMTICWHDVWKSGRRPKWPWDYVVNKFGDGLGSAIIFGSESKGKMETDLRNKVWEVIYYHPSFWPKGLVKWCQELMILKDGDRLERWNISRIEGLNRIREDYKVAGVRITNWGLDLIKRWWLPWRDNEKKYYFPWSKREFLRRKNRYLERLNEAKRK
jgi:hypothetical protein